MVGMEGEQVGRGKGRGGKERRAVVDPGESGDMAPFAGSLAIEVLVYLTSVMSL